MKIGIISDIHGNIDALEEVIKKIEEENCEKIFCLGDLAMAGPEPNKTIDYIKNLIHKKNFTIIQGNTDKMLSHYSEDLHKLVLSKNEIMGHALECDFKEITEDNRNFLKSLPEQKEEEINGVKILLVHGSPRKQDENIFPDMPIEEIEEIIKGTNADVIFCGHTHLPCGYQTRTKQTIVNTGSVGRPFSQYPEACFVIIDIKSDSSFEISHKLIKYDYMKASEKLKNRKFKGSDKLAQMLIKATSRYPE